LLGARTYQPRLLDMVSVPESSGLEAADNFAIPIT